MQCGSAAANYSIYGSRIRIGMALNTRITCIVFCICMYIERQRIRRVAAIRIQSHVRTMLSRRELHRLRVADAERKHIQRISATRIQTQARVYLAKKQLHTLRVEEAGMEYMYYINEWRHITHHHHDYHHDYHHDHHHDRDRKLGFGFVFVLRYSYMCMCM